MPVLVLLSVVGGMQQYMIQKHYLTFNTEQTPTKHLCGLKYAAYNKQF